jgi:hypothetical protein
MRIQRSDLFAYALMTGFGLGAFLLPRDLIGGVETAMATPPSTEVAVELALLIDTSSSVNTNEYNLQKDGYYAAFTDPQFQQNVENIGGIAVIYIEWARQGLEAIQIPWTHLQTAQDCTDFANTIAGLSRAPTDNTTHMATALVFGNQQMQSNKIYTQETNQYNGPGWHAELATIPDTVTINGIAIGSTPVGDFYRDVLVRGPQHFSMHVNNFQQFEDAIIEKLRQEINGTPQLGFYD